MKLTKQELIEKIQHMIDDPKSIISQPYIDGNKVINTIKSFDPEATERERIMQKFPVDSYVKQVKNGAIYQVDYYSKDCVLLKNEATVSTVAVEDLEANFIPYQKEPVDTELEEARKRFPVGSWFTQKDSGSTHFRVKEIKRDKCGVYIVDDSERHHIPDNCTPATLPTAPIKWRCMKTDVPNDINRDKLLYLIGGYGLVRNAVGCYNHVKETWWIDNVWIDLSCYQTALWLELPEAPRGE